ncbi:efflux RND transporter periplasmic adaptor subunit [Pseudooceanicola sp. CBS1P-1]|uniref:Efflux RND transporter periplasmic adaptor subunit n=1 Tax=Pseudooceanicola albus TaxID=2692189 RepID=A0A6L7G2W4_9RHOB|nr:MULTISPECIES: efflux RND transporter periplasmic adaptor subunit [Pseudooceanicola]MBT9384537.1 efflux RND transporter periplasmic adaptor subunit [Pseudooceanicola endophyticus]MXN18239.1 efflux RND transporter periplasmic adaptor subunit [Pseudooceanicola albus]
MTNTLALRRTLAVAALIAMPGLALAQSAGKSGPTEVGVVTLQTASVPYDVTLPGRAVAKDQTEIRPRVEGTIEAINYTAGRSVKAGDILFTLDSDTYDVALAAAQAEKASGEAAVSAAQATVNRYERLNGVGVTQGDLETAQTSLASAKATLSSAEASLKSAQLNLDRTVIRSPIDGVVDVPEFSVGALVTANQTDALTTVTRLDPIYVDVQESSARMLRVRQMISDGTMTPGDKLDATLTLETGQVYEGKGTLVSPSALVSTTTGSLDFRFEFSNPDQLILPGQFLRVELTLGTTQAVLVPQRATDRSSDGTLTAFIAADGVAKQVVLTSKGSYQNAWVVTSGVQAGDKLVVDGLRDLKAGAKITTVPVTINAQGVVQDATGGGTGEGTGTEGGVVPNGTLPEADTDATSADPTTAADPDKGN